ncbi:hypothetical protein N826_20335 [Skermanella aerolata KACC 11604]|nr:hypothetical protein N826_20335 [Skermanella aerolata KACC 11604]
MAAHAVGDEDKPKIIVDLERVFVLRADASDIGAAGELN